MFNRAFSTRRIPDINASVTDLLLGGIGATGVGTTGVGTTGVGATGVGAGIPPIPAQPASPTTPDLSGLSPVTPAIDLTNVVGPLRPGRFGNVIRPPGELVLPPRPPADPDIPRFSGDQTTTHLVNYAMNYLESLPREALLAAMSFINAKPQKVTPPELFEDLRQRTSFDEVLREKAEGWKPITQRVFAEVFAMPADNLAAMDAIVCVALLNRPDLEQVLRRENAAPPTLQDLLENRRIVWQYPAPGTPLTPPYVIVVAVESADPAPAEDIVQCILANLVVTASGYRLPRAAAQKIG